MKLICLHHLLPIIEFASLVWDGCTQQDSNTLQKIQNEAACIVTRSVSTVISYNECGWTYISVRRHQQKLHFTVCIKSIMDYFPYILLINFLH